LARIMEWIGKNVKRKDFDTKESDFGDLAMVS
jgi:hypothetical protein